MKPIVNRLASRFEARLVATEVLAEGEPVQCGVFPKNTDAFLIPGFEGLNLSHDVVLGVVIQEGETF